jgi:hypothetical protein
MEKNAISPRRHTKAHEELKTTAKAIDIEGEYRISNKELRITKFRKTKEKPFAFPSAF